MPQDTTYIYHQVAEGENVEYILNLYQICAPCFAEWNHLDYPSSMPFFEQVMTQRLYEGEYLKVALKKDYEKGFYTENNVYYKYQYFEHAYLYDIATEYKILQSDLCIWNYIGAYAYEVENTTLIVGKIEYKYACPCFE